MKAAIIQSISRSWKELIKEGQSLTFRKGQVLVYEGHSPYGIFVVHSGKIKFSEGGTPCVIEHVWESPDGKVVGLHHFFEQTPFCCTCTATQNCQVIFISKTQLLPFFEGFSPNH